MLRHLSAFFIALTILSSCNKTDDAFVINELVPSNKTGMLAPDGKMHDWIEIRNTSGSVANLKDYVLTTDSTKAEYTFPEKSVQPNECIIVYATKDNMSSELNCGFGVDRKKLHLYLLSPKGKMVSKVEEGKVKTDKALKLTKKGKYKETYKQTPGMDNTDENYEEFLKMKDAQGNSPLRIWEYLSRNCDRDAPDYHAPRAVELKNVSSTDVNLQEFALTNNLDSAKMIALPQRVLKPGELYVFEDSKDQLKKQALILTHNGKYADAVNADKTYLQTSIGRQNDCVGHFYFDTPSIGRENANGYKDVTDKPELATKPGVHNVKSLDITFQQQNAKIYYTLDGSLPTERSAVYDGKITISKSTILKAMAKDSVNMASKVITASFILDKAHNLPVVSLTVDSAHLYDYYKGVFEMGPNARPTMPYMGANFWKPWEKIAHIEFFDGDKGFSTDCAMKIFGAFSRKRPKKSFNIKFKDTFGKSTLDYDLYNKGKKGEWHAFVLRSGSQDDKHVMLRDEFFTSLMTEKSPTLLAQDYRPVALYLNGNYFGLYYIREKINKHFVADHLKVNPETVTLIEAMNAVKEGNIQEYSELKSYITSHDMRDKTAFEYAKKHIDFTNLIDYKLGEFYTGNCDTGNIRYCKSSDPSCNQKWHWIYYDLDWGFYYNTPLSFYVREGGSKGFLNVFSNRLLRNPEFRDLFLQRWAFHLKNTFSEENALKVVNNLANTINEEMKRNCKRWPEMSYEKWQKNMEEFRGRIKARPAIMHANVLSELNVTEAEKVKYFGK